MMRSALPTTFAAVLIPSLRRTATSKDSAARVLEAVVFREILKPLTAGLGPLAEIAAEPIADKLAGVTKR